MTPSEILSFERGRWKHLGAKESAIRVRFGVSAVVYFAALDRVLDDPASLAIDAVTVKRLQRLRESRRRARSAWAPRTLV